LQTIPSRGIAAGMDRKDVGKDIIQGALVGAVGRATLGALNITAMGPALYSGPIGRYTPVFRSAGLFT